MFIKVLIISIILVAIVMLTLGIKMWFNPDAEFTTHSCKLDEENADSDSGCFICQLKDLADCPENEDSKIKTK
ncbi:MAG: hypothetical protein P1P82_17175 [Bacteroidales bacterium]|nr:hypothetical protein [Bacteroidales bacterium]